MGKNKIAAIVTISNKFLICVPTATLDGGVGLLLPMQEKTYRRLLMLQNALNVMLPHHAGLNPKAFRFVSTCLSSCIFIYIGGVQQLSDRFRFDDLI